MDGHAAPPLLLLYWNCKRFSTTPSAGGMLDQDYRMVRMMTAADNVYNVARKYRNALGRNIHKLTDSDRRLLSWLKDRELWHG